MNNEIRKSKIYAYFHGANNVFQQFIIAAGILLILLGLSAGQAQSIKASNLYDKYQELDDIAYNYEEAYEDLYYDLRYDYDFDYSFTMYEKIEEVEKDNEYYEQIKAYNEALEEYQKAEEDATKAYEKYDSACYTSSAGEVLLPLLGGIFVIVGAIWSIVKKFSFDRKSCEQAYDEEIQIKIEEAKVKALEKLNIVAEQIDKVEPVVLNGIASYDSASNKNPVGKLALLFQGILNLFTYVEVVIIGAIVAAIYYGISLAFASAFIIPVIGAFALIAVVGKKVYDKYEKNFYVSPKSIEKLENLYPSLSIRLGTDDNIRVSLPAITVYMFGDEQIYMYYQYFDIVTGKTFCEGIHEYFYEDVVGVVSAQEIKKLFKRTGFLKLFVTAVDYLKESITVVTSGCEHSETYIVPKGSSLLDTSFVGMRNLIRQKKSDKE